jgi:hypothetical protein
VRIESYAVKHHVQPPHRLLATVYPSLRLDVTG